MTERRWKIPITTMQMCTLLGLPASVRVVGMRVVPDPDVVHVLVEGEILPPQEAHGTDYAEMAFHGSVEAPYLWHPLAAHAVTWGGWKPGDGPDDIDVPTSPLSRSTITTRLASVLAEHGGVDSARDARLLRALANTVERLVAEGAVAGS